MAEQSILGTAVCLVVSAQANTALLREKYQIGNPGFNLAEIIDCRQRVIRPDMVNNRFQIQVGSFCPNYLKFLCHSVSRLTAPNPQRLHLGKSYARFGYLLHPEQQA